MNRKDIGNFEHRFDMLQFTSLYETIIYLINMIHTDYAKISQNQIKVLKKFKNDKIG